MKKTKDRKIEYLPYKPYAVGSYKEERIERKVLYEKINEIIAVLNKDFYLFKE